MDKEKEPLREEEVDFFTELMFGRRMNNRENHLPAEDTNAHWKENNNSNDTPNAQNQSFLDEKNLPIPHWLKNMDYGEIFNHIDTILTSTKELKPLLKKITPFIETILQKSNKS